MKYNSNKRHSFHQKILVRCIFFILLFQGISTFSQVKLPSFFADNMVLQQNDSISIWGWDVPNTTIAIQASWGVESSTKTDVNGKWKTELRTPKGSFTPYKIQIQGSTAVSINNVLAGEVWLCSGQSNMEMPMKGLGKSPVDRSSEFLKTAQNPFIRLFNTERAGSLQPETDVVGNWLKADSVSASNFSAIGYLFGKKLFDKLQVPIGIVEAAWGGTRIEAWLPKEVLQSDERVKLPEKLPLEPNKRKLPTLIYNGMIHPYQNFSIRGFLWYQGETNRTNPEPYNSYLHHLVNTWRAQWNDQELPFYIVQIAPYAYEKYRKTPAIQAALIREAQLLASQEIPNSGMVVTADVGHCSDIHPPKKEPIAERLSYWALHNQYGFSEIVCQAPLLASQKIRENRIRLYFKSGSNDSKEAVTSFEKPLTGLTVAGADKIFYPAEALIMDDGSLSVFSNEVPLPVAVRYGFEDCFDGNLYGKSKLPVSSFRTDSW